MKFKSIGKTLLKGLLGAVTLPATGTAGVAVAVAKPFLNAWLGGKKKRDTKAIRKEEMEQALHEEQIRQIKCPNTTQSQAEIEAMKGWRDNVLRIVMITAFLLFAYPYLITYIFAPWGYDAPVENLFKAMDMIPDDIRTIFHMIIASLFGVSASGKIIESTVKAIRK